MKKKKPVTVFRRLDDDLKVIFQSNTRQTTLRKTGRASNEVET